MKMLFSSILLLCTFFPAILIAQYDLLNKIVASDRGEDFHFSHHKDAISIYDEYAVVGAHFHDYDTLDRSGQAYLFKWDAMDCKWIEIDIMVPEIAVGVIDPDIDDNDEFGNAVCIYNDIIAVSAPLYDGITGDAGIVYIYRIIGDEAVFVERILPIDNIWLMNDSRINGFFGSSLDHDGTNLIVGAPGNTEGGSTNAGAAYIYEWSGSNFNFKRHIKAPVPRGGSEFGGAVAIAGSFAVIGAQFETNVVDGDILFGMGAAYVFSNISGTWAFDQKLVAPDADEEDNFGFQ